MELISRQAAIDEIDEWIKAFRENGHRESAADACLIQDGIIQLPPAQPEPKWIPCSERLPSEGENVLLCDSLLGNVAIGRLIRYNTSCCWEVDHWDCDFEDWQAWMPLPEPYAERRTDEAD